MSMSMPMGLPVIPTAAPIPLVAPVSSAPVSSAPVVLAPAVLAPSTSNSVPSTAPSSTTTMETMEVTTSALLSDGSRVSLSGKTGSTAFVVMASAGGIVLLAALAIRRSGQKNVLEEVDAPKDDSTVNDEEHSFVGVDGSLVVVADGTSKIAV